MFTNLNPLSHRKIEKAFTPIHAAPNDTYSLMHHNAFNPPHHNIPHHVYAMTSSERISNARGVPMEDPDNGGMDASALPFDQYIVTRDLDAAPGAGVGGPDGELTAERAMEVDAARALEELAVAGRMGGVDAWHGMAAPIPEPGPGQGKLASTSNLPSGDPYSHHPGVHPHDAGLPPPPMPPNGFPFPPPGIPHSHPHLPMPPLSPNTMQIDPHGADGSDGGGPGSDREGDADSTASAEPELESRTMGEPAPPMALGVPPNVYFPPHPPPQTSGHIPLLPTQLPPRSQIPPHPVKRRIGSSQPVPVPHLLKPSRGRRVPTAQGFVPNAATPAPQPNPNVIEGDTDANMRESPPESRSGTSSPYGTRSSGRHSGPGQPSAVTALAPVPIQEGLSGKTAAEVAAKIHASARAYICKVEGCGKAFRRGEHLKRHVRSLHTHEKPERCTYPGCNKEFSRKDNMQQHLKIHTTGHQRSYAKRTSSKSKSKSSRSPSEEEDDGSDEDDE
ncbi:hypothetical protein FRB90_007568 [Tulasnella sp. 427]|nr:hypothetical protein FRB90_007568 [Tulasnella sp. 427]